MAFHISLELPPNILEYLQQTAARRQQSVETVLLEDLMLLAEYTLPPLDQLSNLSDEKLHALLRQPFNPLYRQRLDELTAEGKQRGLTPSETRLC